MFFRILTKERNSHTECKSKFDTCLEGVSCQPLFARGRSLQPTTVTTMATSWFTDIKQAEPIEVFALVQRYNEDTDPKKVNLSVGGRIIINLIIMMSFLLYKS